MARLLDLPTEIRLQILSHLFSDHLLFTTSPTINNADAGPRPKKYWWRLCACRQGIYPLPLPATTGALSVVPICKHRDPASLSTAEDDIREDATRMAVLAVSKQIYREARDALDRHVYAFRHPADFDAVLLAGKGADGKDRALEKLRAVVCPGGLEAHLWNVALRQVYVPRGTWLRSFERRFPALTALELCVRGTGVHRPGAGFYGWSWKGWVVGFQYLMLEGLRDVRVDAGGYVEILGRGGEMQSVAGDAVRPGIEEKRKYEDALRGLLMSDFRDGGYDYRGDPLPTKGEEIEMDWSSYWRLTEKGSQVPIDRCLL